VASAEGLLVQTSSWLQLEPRCLYEAEEGLATLPVQFGDGASAPLFLHTRKVSEMSRFVSFLQQSVGSNAGSRDTYKFVFMRFVSKT